MSRTMVTRLEVSLGMDMRLTRSWGGVSHGEGAMWNVLFLRSVDSRPGTYRRLLGMGQITEAGWIRQFRKRERHHLCWFRLPGGWATGALYFCHEVRAIEVGYTGLIRCDVDEKMDHMSALATRKT